MKAPFIKNIKSSGGSLYIFSSASDDLNFLLNDSDDRDFIWSKFVLLDIPNELKPTGKKENYIQYASIPGAFEHTMNKQSKIKLTESFQNYCLNFESLLISDDSYDSTSKRTVNERVFFKWLKELGALRFKQALSNERSNKSQNALFTEEDWSVNNHYSKVVQYIGDIDMVNTNKNKHNSYSEIYIHVPISHGNTKTVLFRTIDDNNYKQNKVYQSHSSGVNAKFLNGRTSTDIHPMGLNTNAFYDSPENSFLTNAYQLQVEEINQSTQTRIFKNGWWYDNAISNSYVTSKKFSDQQNDKLKIIGKGQYLNNNVDFLRSRLDGISIEFDEESYYDILTNPSINSFAEYNASTNSKAFNFNAVLLYYDVFDRNDPTNKTSNLFGVLFINPPEEQSIGGSKLKRLQKIKPNPVTGDNGDAWGLKVNLKIDTSNDTTQVESIINEYNTFSMELFLDALSQLVQVSNSMENMNYITTDLANKYKILEDYVYRNKGIEEVKLQIDDLYTLIAENANIFKSNETLVQLINRAFIEINNIYANNTSLDVTYNLDVIKEGFGNKIEITGKNIKITSSLQDFYIPKNPVYSIMNDFVNLNDRYQLEIQNINQTQYIRIEESGYTEHETNFDINKNIEVLIDDTKIKWTNGKKIRISFGTNYRSNTLLNINFFTDKEDNLNNGKSFGQKINTNRITSNIFKIKEKTINNQIISVPPIIEVTCIDEKKLKFLIDIF